MSASDRPERPPAAIAISAFDAVIFDMDGLLLDSERPIRDAWIAAAAARGIALGAAAYQSAIGLSAHESRRRLAALVGGMAAYEAVHADAARRLAGCVFPAKRGAAELLALLATRGVARAVASSTARREARRRLDAAGLGRDVESLTGGDEVPAGRGKPNPDLYWLAAERLGRHPSRCIVFEDSEPGARAALAAGMRLVIVPDLEVPADAVCRRAWRMLDSLESALGDCGGWFAGMGVENNGENF